MRNLILRVVVIGLLASPMVGRANVLTFDDLPSGANFFTQTYHGFNFGDNNLRTNPWFYSYATDSFYVPHSGTHFVATDYSLYPGSKPLSPTQLIVSATSFTFDGAWFSGLDTVEYALFSGSTLVYTSTSPSPKLTNVPQFVASGYAGQVTGVQILGTQGYYAMDDFTYNSAPPENVVPEPSSGSLLFAGLLAIFLGIRCRKPCDR